MRSVQLRFPGVKNADFATKKAEKSMSQKLARGRNQRRFAPSLELLESRTLLNAGAPDPTFGGMGGLPPGTATAVQGFTNVSKAVAVQPDGKILVLAFVTSETGKGDFAEGNTIFRFSTNGTLDTTFGTYSDVGPNLSDNWTGIAVTASGMIVVSGGALNPLDPGGIGPFIFELNSDGTRNTSFGGSGAENGLVIGSGGGNTVFSGVVIQPDGKIVVASSAGSSTTTDGLQRFNPDGTPDATFKNQPLQLEDAAPRLALATDGKILLSGQVNAQNVGLFRANPDGSWDTSFGSNGTVELVGNSVLHGLAVQADNRVLVAYSSGGGESVCKITRINVNGFADVTFGEGGSVTTTFGGAPGSARPSTVLVQLNGRIILAGDVISSGLLGLARFDPNGSVDTSFGTNGVTTLAIPAQGGVAPNATADAAALAPNGEIVTAGNWDTAPGQVEVLAARFMGDTPTGTAHQQLVSQLYLDLLQRTVDPSGLANWTGALDSGQETAQQVALNLENSQEYHDLVVNQLYGEYLNRPADPSGLAHWAGFLANGGTEDQLRAVLLGSAEHFTVSGNSTSGFLSSLFVDVLGRPIDAGSEQAWSQVLADGASRTAVAAAIIRSTEGNDHEVSDLYFWILHRAPDAFGLQSFANELAQGIPMENIAATLFGSGEYATTRT
jgi:uncharacterized delta-60 repeat protein